MKRNNKMVFVWLGLLIFALLLSGCGENTAAQPARDPDLPPNIIEPGVPQAPAADDPAANDPSEEDPFPDKESASTQEDLAAAQSRIESYYFEQMLEYPDGYVFNQVWYKNGKMKVLSSVDGYGLTELYYDYDACTVVSCTPGLGNAVMWDFDPASPDAPDNPILDDYTAYTPAGEEVIDRQYCMILQTPEGELLWVGTKYGFPLQVEFTDSLGERMTTQYKNVSINTVKDEEVVPPDDMEIYYGDDAY